MALEEYADLINQAKEMKVLIKRPAAILNLTKTFLRAYGSSCGCLYDGLPKAHSITSSGLSWLRVHRVNKNSQMGVKSVLFFGAGEPLMDKKLFPLIEHSNKIGLYAVMFTNASLVTGQIAERIKSLDLSVVVSVKSRNAKVLEELTGVKGSAKRICRGFQHLLDVGLNESKPTRLGMDILICRQVCDEVPELIRYCIGNNIHPMVESLLWKGRAVKNYAALEPTSEQKLSKKLAKEFPQLARERAYFEGSACDLDRYSIFVNYDGDVWQCFSRDMVAGNAKREKLREIWNKPVLKRLRESPANKSCGMCQGRRYNLEKCLKAMNHRPSRIPC